MTASEKVPTLARRNGFSHQAAMEASQRKWANLTANGKVAGMSRISCRLNRKWLALAITSIATLGVLTGCAGPSLADTEPASSLKDGVAGAREAPAPPEQGPRPVEDAQRDVVKTASMTI